jgi:hypothetical protein
MAYPYAGFAVEELYPPSTAGTRGWRIECECPLGKERRQIIIVLRAQNTVKEPYSTPPPVIGRRCATRRGVCQGYCELERLAMCGHFRRNGRVWSCSLTYTNRKNALAGRNRQARRPGARE